MMTAEQLKSSILQLAMQGKLVEQRQGEGTGKNLLKLIETHFKDTKKLYIDNDELPFEIPVSWAWTKVGNITMLYNGRAFKPSDWSDDGLPIVRIQNLNDENAPFNRYNGSFDEIHHLYGGELLFAWSGTPGTSFGAHIWRKQEAVLNQHIFKIGFPESYLDKKYFAHALNFQVLSLIRLAHGSAGLQHVTKGIFQNTLIPIPPLAEQKRIVAKIEELMPFVKQYAVAITKLNTLNASFPEMMKKSILQEAVQGKLVPQDPNDEPASLLLKKIAEEKKRLTKEGKIKKQKPLPEITEEEIPFDIPESWEWVRIGEIFKVGTGMTPLKGNALFYDGGTIPWITSSLTSERYITQADSFVTQYAVENTTLTVYPAHSLIIAMYGQGKTRGQVSELLINATTNQACAVLEYYLYYSELIEYTYYYFMFNYDVLRKKAEGTSQPNLNLKKIAETIIPIPPLNEQRRIIAKTKEIIYGIDILSSKL